VIAGVEGRAGREQLQTASAAERAARRPARRPCAHKNKNPTTVAGTAAQPGTYKVIRRLVASKPDETSMKPNRQSNRTMARHVSLTINNDGWLRSATTSRMAVTLYSMRSRATGQRSTQAVRRVTPSSASTIRSAHKAPACSVMRQAEEAYKRTTDNATTLCGVVVP